MRGLKAAGLDCPLDLRASRDFVRVKKLRRGAHISMASMCDDWELAMAMAYAHEAAVWTRAEATEGRALAAAAVSRKRDGSFADGDDGGDFASAAAGRPVATPKRRLLAAGATLALRVSL